MAKSILVTGGAGYIGSHTVLQLLLGGFKVVVVDNLDNASEIAVKRVAEIAGEVGKKNLVFHKVQGLRILTSFLLFGGGVGVFSLEFVLVMEFLGLLFFYMFHCRECFGVVHQTVETETVENEVFWFVVSVENGIAVEIK